MRIETASRSSLARTDRFLTVAGFSTAEIMRTAGLSNTAVWRGKERFMKEGVDGLLRDNAPTAPEVADRVVAQTLEEPPGETT